VLTTVPCLLPAVMKSSAPNPQTQQQGKDDVVNQPVGPVPLPV
jgi:hypothetical protein